MKLLKFCSLRFVECSLSLLTGVSLLPADESRVIPELPRRLTVTFEGIEDAFLSHWSRCMAGHEPIEYPKCQPLQVMKSEETNQD